MIYRQGASKKAAWLRGKAEDKKRLYFYNPNRQALKPYQYLAGDEKPMRRRGCQARKGLPAQPAPPVCPYILQPGKGHRKACGHSRSFKHKYHTDLYYLHRCGAPPQNGEYAADNLKSRPKTAAEYINGIM